MSQTPLSSFCPPYIPATQITPDSIDEIPSQENSLFTQESRRILFDPVDLANNHNIGRNYYDQLFSSDSEDDESIEYDESSDMSISDSDYSISSSSNKIHNERNYYVQLFSSDSETDESLESESATKISNEFKPLSTLLSTPRELSAEAASSSDMSISDSESSENTYISFDINESDTNSSTSDETLSTQSSDDSSSTKSTLASLCFDEWEDGNETWGITRLLDKDAIDDLLGVNEDKQQPSIQLEVQNESETDKIGPFNIRNKYDHDLAAFFMMKEDLTFLSLQEPYSSVSQTSNKSWSSYKKSELESARITCFETPFQIILFDSWK